MSKSYSAKEIVEGACPPNQSGGVLAVPGYYSGRGPMPGDLNDKHLEKIHGFIKTKIGEREAKAFVKMVHKTDDMSATNFLQEFFRFVDNGFAIPKKARTGVYLTGRGKTLEADATGHVMGALFSSNRKENPKITKMISDGIKNPFLTKHLKDLPKNAMMCPGLIYDMWG